MKSIISASAALSSLKNAGTLARTILAMYSTSVRSGSEFTDIEEEFKKRFDLVVEEFKSHRAIHHPFYKYLEEQSKEGFNADQFRIYRDNFFYRTQLTIPSVARTIERASLSEDFQTVADTIRNLFDEGGYGDPNRIHSKLLMDSHNRHGETVFGLKPMTSIRKTKDSAFLIPEVEDYRDSKLAVFSRMYPFVAGNTFAHEFAADDMLVNFRKAFFEPYKGYYSPESYTDLIAFFTAHKDDEVEGGDVEAQHERMARAAAIRACEDNLHNVSRIREGGLEFLNHQAKLWDGMLREMEKAQTKSKPIPTKTEFKKPGTNPKPSLSKEVEGKTGKER